MKIIVDENIAYGREAFEGFGEVTLMHGRKIARQDAAHADALVIRSITKANAGLLEGSDVKFIGTATIGTDHLDTDWLKKNAVSFSSARGCNARAVAEYVITAIIDITKNTDLRLSGKTIAVIGAGNIGSKIVRIAKDLGLKVIVNDPPLERQDNRPDYDFVSLEEALTANIITLHVPLIKDGPDKTGHLLNAENLKLLKDDAILINSSRGPVVDNLALANLLEMKKEIQVCLDVWENEPAIDGTLLNLVTIATPHVAGYSLEGKAAGTKIIHDALAGFFGHAPVWTPELPPLLEPGLLVDGRAPLETAIHQAVSKVYFIREDNMLMRKMLSVSENARKEYFDRLRKNYTPRREFNNYSVTIKPANNQLAKAFTCLGFNLHPA